MRVFNFIVCLFLATQLPGVYSTVERRFDNFLGVDAPVTRGRSFGQVLSPFSRPRSAFETKERNKSAPVDQISDTFEVFNYFDKDIFIADPTNPKFEAIRVCSGCSANVKKPNKMTQQYVVLDAAQTQWQRDSFVFRQNQQVYITPNKYNPEDKKVVKFVFYDTNRVTGLKSIGFYDARGIELEHSRFYINDILDNSFDVRKKNKRGELVIKAVVDKSAVSYILKCPKESEIDFPTPWHVIVDDKAVAFHQNEVEFHGGNSQLLPLFDVKTSDALSLGAIVKIVNHENGHLNNQFGVVVAKEGESKVRFCDEENVKVRFDNERFGVRDICEINLQLLKDVKPQFSFLFKTIASRNEKLISFESIRLYDVHEREIKVRFRMNEKFGNDLTWARGKKGWSLDAYTYGNQKIAYYSFFNGPDENKIPFMWQVFDADKKEVDSQRLTDIRDRMEAKSHKKFYLLSNVKKALTFNFTSPRHISRQVKMRSILLKERKGNKEIVFSPLLIHENQENCNKKKLEFTISHETPYTIDVYTGPDQFVTGYEFVYPDEKLSDKHKNSFAPHSWVVYDHENNGRTSETSDEALTHGFYDLWKPQLKFKFEHCQGDDDFISFKEMKFYSESGKPVEVKLLMNGKLGTDLTWEKQKVQKMKVAKSDGAVRKPSMEEFEWILEVLTNGQTPIVSYEITTNGVFTENTGSPIYRKWDVQDSQENSLLSQFVPMHPGASEKFLLNDKEKPVFGAPRLEGHQKRRTKKITTSTGTQKATKALRFHFDEPRSGNLFLLEHIDLFDKNEKPFTYVALKTEDATGKKEDLKIGARLQLQGATYIHVYIPADKKVSGYAFRPVRNQKNSLPQKWRVEEGNGDLIETRDEVWDEKMSPVFYLWANKDHMWKDGTGASVHGGSVHSGSVHSGSVHSGSDYSESVHGGNVNARSLRVERMRRFRFQHRSTKIIKESPNEKGNIKIDNKGRAIKSHTNEEKYRREKYAYQLFQKKKTNERFKLAPALRGFNDSRMELQTEEGEITFEDAMEQFRNNRKTEETTEKFQHFLNNMKSCLKILDEWKFVHGDIKPANIMKFRDHVWKLIDWDSSGPVDKERGSGTLHYAAPEVVLGEVETLQTTQDVWSVGAIAFEYLMGHKVYSKKVGNEFVEAKTEEELMELARNWKLENYIPTDNPKYKLLKQMLAPAGHRLNPNKIKPSLDSTKTTDLKLRKEQNQLLKNIQSGIQVVQNQLDFVRSDIYKQLLSASTQLPYLYVALPTKPPQNLLSAAMGQSFVHMKVFVPCQISDHKGEQLHFTDHPGFDVKLPKKSIAKLSKAFSIGLKVLHVTSTVSGFGFDSTPFSEYLDKYNQITSSNGAKNLLENARDTFDKYQRSGTAEASSGFGELEEYLKSQNYDRMEGGLTAGLKKVLDTESGKHLWVCEKHSTKEQLEKYGLITYDHEVEGGQIRM